MRVKDSSGTIVHGLKRTRGGGIAVDNNSEYIKYMKEKEAHASIILLKEEVDQLKQLVTKLLNKIG